MYRYFGEFRNGTPRTYLDVRGDYHERESFSGQVCPALNVGQHLSACNSLLHRSARRDRARTARDIWDFGASGFSFKKAFNEAHILAISQAVCLYRNQQHIDGPLFLGMDTHALSEPAFASALEVLAANGVEVMIDCDSRLYPDSCDLSRNSDV